MPLVTPCIWKSLPDRYGWRYNKDCSGEFGPENNGEDPKGLGTGFVNDAIELPATIELTLPMGVVEGDVEADVIKEGLDSENEIKNKSYDALLNGIYTLN